MMVALVAVLCCSVTAFAGEDTYSGDFLSRSTLSGDWGGVRNDMAKKGVTFDVNMTQTEQGVVGGGKSSSWEYGGRGILILKMDTGKMGLWPGGFLTTELEGNWGHGINGSTGALSPVNDNQIYPVPARAGVAIPALNFTQFLSEYGGVYAGKLDITSADMNEFAHGTYGKGDTQFMNLSLNINTALITEAPYTPLGAGVLILPTKDYKAAIINLGVMSSEGTASTSGFDTLNANKLTFAGEARVRTDFFDKTGHQLIGYAYSNKEFTSLDQRLRSFIETRETLKEKGSWGLYYNFDQYLYEPVKGSGKGFGIFGRFGTSDGNPNPVHYLFSLGAGGKGLMASRPDDQFGVGWYYINTKGIKITGPFATREALSDEQGFEAYYSVALTKWALLTPDIQVVRPMQKNDINGNGIGPVTVLGLRLQLLL
jgi:porin